MAKYSAKMLELASDLILKYEQAILDLEENKIPFSIVRVAWSSYGSSTACEFCIETGYNDTVGDVEENRACGKCILNRGSDNSGCCRSTDGDRTFSNVAYSLGGFGREIPDGSPGVNSKRAIVALKNRLAWILKTIEEAGYEVSAL